MIIVGMNVESLYIFHKKKEKKLHSSRTSFMVKIEKIISFVPRFPSQFCFKELGY